MTAVLWVVLVIVLAFWVLGQVFKIAGSAVHLLLIVALAVLIYNIVIGRRA